MLVKKLLMRTPQAQTKFHLYWPLLVELVQHWYKMAPLDSLLR